MSLEVKNSNYIPPNIGWSRTRLELIYNVTISRLQDQLNVFLEFAIVVKTVSKKTRSVTETEKKVSNLNKNKIRIRTRISKNSKYGLKRPQPLTAFLRSRTLP